MKKILLIPMLIIAFLLSACVTQPAVSTPPSTEPSAGQTEAGVSARPGSGITGDESDNLQDLIEARGTVKEVNGDLVLITLSDNGNDFMLRFSENSKYDEGISKDIKAGNKIKCMVKPEETFAPPSQGEVYEVIANEAL
jgi:hypothetical protein